MGANNRQNAGFTLLETVLVLSISSLLAIVLLNSFSNSQRQTRFTDAIESVISGLEKTRQEANSVYTTGSGNDPNSIFLAKVAAFDPGFDMGRTYRVHTLTAPRSEALSLPINQEATQSEPIPWGVRCVCNESNSYIHFVRLPGSTQLRVYLEDRVSQQVSDYNLTANYSNLCFESPEGLRAVVTINSSTGEITRNYVDNC